MIQDSQRNPSAGADAVSAGLNGVQRQAVEHAGGPLLILAGAGSGKTRVLTRRVAHLVRARGIAPERILALTFTNKAAGEMAARIEALLAQPVRGLWVGTFHAICLRWLRRHAVEAGYRPGLSVFDADDQRALVRRLLKAEGFSETPRAARDALAVISRAKCRAETPAEVSAAARAPAQMLAARIYAAYQEALRSQNAADFDDLLLGVLRLFETRPAIAEAYARQFLHVLVDEYQDTNHVQFRLVQRLAQIHRNIFVVGDDDQSIYGWRGADISNIIDFREHFPEATVLRLEQNYRSTAAVLALANSVIAHNTSRWEKSLWTERQGGRKPELFLAGDEDEEAQEVARRIAAAVATGRTRHGEIAVFYRTHAQSRPFEDAFLRSQIPYVLVGGVYFYQRREVKDLLSYLRVLANPADEVSLERALGAPRRGIGEQSIAALLAAARAQGADALAVAAGGEIPGVRGKAREALAGFARAMLAWRARLTEPPELILSEIIAAVDYRGHLEQQGGDWEERAANVEELLAGARLYSSTHGGGVAGYLDQVSLLTDLDSLKENGDHVTLMTVHNAKGLEFPRVYVTGLEEGLFPHISAFDDRAEMEEERRLFYVACTRAMDELTLSACLLRRRFNAAAGGVSRFVGEITPGLYEETDLGSVAWLAPRGPEARADAPAGRPQARPGARGASAAARRGGRGRVPGRQSDEGAGESDDLEHPMVGRRVFHATFGPGIVVAAEGRGERARVTVRFHSGATRKVVGGYLEWEP